MIVFRHSNLTVNVRYWQRTPKPNDDQLRVRAMELAAEVSTKFKS